MCLGRKNYLSKKEKEWELWKTSRDTFGSDDDLYEFHHTKTDPDTGEIIKKPVPKDQDGKLVIPVDPEKVKPGDKVVKVTVKDSEPDKESEPTEVRVVEIPKELEQIKLYVKNIAGGEKGISLTTNPAEAKIDVYKNGVRVAGGYTDSLGNASIVL